VPPPLAVAVAAVFAAAFASLAAFAALKTGLTPGAALGAVLAVTAAEIAATASASAAMAAPPLAVAVEALLVPADLRLGLDGGRLGAEDLVIDLQSLLRSALVAWLSRGATTIGLDDDWGNVAAIEPSPARGISQTVARTPALSRTALARESTGHHQGKPFTPSMHPSGGAPWPWQPLTCRPRKC